MRNGAGLYINGDPKEYNYLNIKEIHQVCKVAPWLCKNAPFFPVTAVQVAHPAVVKVVLVGMGSGLTVPTQLQFN